MTYSPRSRAAGFSLLEILIVVAIIAVIGGMVAQNVFGGADRANVKLAQSQIQTLSGKIEQFQMDTGEVPGSLEDLVNSPSGVTGWLGPYAKVNELKDPWKRPFRYQVPGEDGRPFELVSLGKDGRDGGESVNADIRNE